MLEKVPNIKQDISFPFNLIPTNISIQKKRTFFQRVFLTTRSVPTKLKTYKSKQNEGITLNKTIMFRIK